MNFSYHIPTKIVFGKGSLKQLSGNDLPGKSALIVCTNGNSVKKYGYLDTLTGELDKKGIKHHVYAKVEPNPTKDQVMEGASLCREHNVDFVIGFGGGSAIDASKAIAIMATNPGDYWDYIMAGSGKQKPVEIDPLPIVAITTTAGTGTEADPWAVVTNGTEKIGYGFVKTFPTLAVVDPELMVSVPKYLTACQGFDALFHCTEGYLRSSHYIMSDMYALQGMELVAKSIVDAVSDGNNIEARGNVALGNTFGGLVQSTSGCISEHSMAHALSAYHPNFEHGAALICISEAYYTFIAQSGQCDDRLIKMAQAIGKPNATKAMDFVEALQDLKKQCGVDDIKMSDYGVKLEEIEKYATNARENMGKLFTFDPIEINHQSTVEIFTKSFK